MKNYKKLGIVLMVVAVVVTGLVLGACKQTFEFDPNTTGYGGGNGTGVATVTITGKKYEVKYNSKTASGTATKTSVSFAGIDQDLYQDGSVFSAYIFEKKLTDLWVDKDGIRISWDGSVAKKSVDGDGNPIDVELIIIEE